MKKSIIFCLVFGIVFQLTAANCIHAEEQELKNHFVIDMVPSNLADSVKIQELIFEGEVLSNTADVVDGIPVRRLKIKVLDSIKGNAQSGDIVEKTVWEQVASRYPAVEGKRYVYGFNQEGKNKLSAPLLINYKVEESTDGKNKVHVAKRLNLHDLNTNTAYKSKAKLSIKTQAQIANLTNEEEKNNGVDVTNLKDTLRAIVNDQQE